MLVACGLVGLRFGGRAILVVGIVRNGLPAQVRDSPERVAATSRADDKDRAAGRVVTHGLHCAAAWL